MNRGSRTVVAAYLALGALFTLGASLIWAINTIFLIREGGLTILGVMLVNASFTVAQMVFEVPTGVVADTIGRRASILLSMATLVGSTVLYAITPEMGWGMAGFVIASIVLGLGYTFQTGATDAWLVDALDASGWEGAKDRVFAWGQISWGVGMFVGSLLGGILGQADLVWPYLLRAAVLAGAFVLTLVVVHDTGFEPRPLRRSTFRAETRAILTAGTRYGWRSPVVRPLLWGSALGGLFYLYGFYAWQPYVLDLLGRDYVWLLGVVQAGISLANIGGNMLVGRVSGAIGRSGRPRLLEAASWTSAAVVLAIGSVGFLAETPGLLPAGIAIGLWLAWSVVLGVYQPIRMSYLNDHIPSPQRATVLSLDAFFADGGGAAGQPALGWLSERCSIPLAWTVGALCLAAQAPLYRISGRAAAKEEREASAGRQADPATVDARDRASG